MNRVRYVRHVRLHTMNRVRYARYARFRHLHHHLCAVAVVVGVLGGLVAQRKVLDRLPQGAEALQVAVPAGGSWREYVELPGKGVVRGIARCRDELWLVRDRLLVMNAADREVRRKLPAPKGLLGMTADERFVYLLRRKHISVLDARAAQEVRRISLGNAHAGAPSAIAAHGKQLFVVWPDGLFAFDKRTGKARECVRPRFLPRWLASDGESLWAGASHRFCRIGTATASPAAAGAKRARELLQPAFEPSCGTFTQGRLLWIETPRPGTRTVGTVVAPESAWASEQLAVKLQRDGDGLHYVIGPRPVEGAANFADWMRRLAKDPACTVPWFDGECVLMPVVLVVHPGVTVGDLAAAWDVASAAGFENVSVESHVGMPLPEEPPPPPPREGKDG